MPHATPRPASNAWQLVDSVLFVAALVVCKLALELSPFVRQWQAETIASLQQRLWPQEYASRLPVVVFDLSRINLAPGAEGAPGVSIIPRESLRALLDAFEELKVKPLAIGIDLDFSTTDAGEPVDPADAALFDKAAEMRDRGSPVYFGVERQAFAAPGLWLPANNRDELAGGILPGSVAWRLPVESAGPGRPGLPSLAERLSERLPSSGPQEGAGGVHPFGALVTEYSEVHYPWHGRVTERTIDLSPLYALEDGKVTVLKGYEKAAVAMASLRFPGSVVIIGDASLSTRDGIIVVGGFPPTFHPGLFFQACAVVTAWRGNLYELTALGRLLADVALGLGLLGLVTFITAAYERGPGGRSLHTGALHWLVTLLAAAAVIFTGYWLVPYTRLLWIDFDLVAAVLILHAPTERAFHRLRKAFTALFLHPGSQ